MTTTAGPRPLPSVATLSTGAPHLEEAAELNGPALQAAARDAWRATPTLTGADLGGRFGRSDRWGRDRIAEAKAALPPAATTAADTDDGSRFPAAGAPTARPGTDNGAPGIASAAARHTTAADRQPAPVPAALVIVTVAAVAIVAAVTTVVSYSHTHDLALLAGQHWLAKVVPAAVDGLVVAGSTSLLVDRRTGSRGHPLAWAAIALGLATSMAANVVAVDPTLVDLRVVKWVMAGYAPVALAISGHLLIRMLGEGTTTR